MSTAGKRDFRPAIHFTPQKGWINDPNGLFFENGRYHLFYQYYPDDTKWGPMHWGHAISRDLLHWEHQPIALYPDKLGFIFSGSAVYDAENRSGFGKDGKAPVIAMYTSHGDTEQQSIAYSLDGVNYTPYEGNPVIPNPGIKDFRDPKIFWNPVRNCWSMILAAADRVHFYATENFKEWTKTGEYGPGGNYCPGVWECPDLVPLETSQGVKWVLIDSMTSTPENRRINLQYFIGDFDGDTFRSTADWGKTELVDEGFDNYAAVTFNNLEEKLLVGWGVNWLYAADTPTNEYCGQMTLARKLFLVDVPSKGLRLGCKPVGIDKYLGEECPVEQGQALTGETFALRLKGEGTCRIVLTNKEGQTLLVGVDGDNHFYVDRTNAGAVDFNEHFATQAFSVAKAERLYTGEYTMDLVFDVSMLEAFIDQGTRSISMVAYPDSPYNKIEIQGKAKAWLQYINE